MAEIRNYTINFGPSTPLPTGTSAWFLSLMAKLWSALIRISASFTVALKACRDQDLGSAGSVRIISTTCP